ncbi:hypothetical protein [Streptomyces griseus]|uniref:hypothetical protein n=1 Tax=Streptomyces griseus TaxID=1911 RepID=UPI00131D14B0|nr:hypothetical protein [Streptomyces griseus]
MSPGPGAAADMRALSPECTLARQPGYEDVHGACRRLTDIPLPYGGGLLLVRRCDCACHRPPHRREE